MCVSIHDFSCWERLGFGTYWCAWQPLYSWLLYFRPSRVLMCGTKLVFMTSRVRNVDPGCQKLARMRQKFKFQNLTGWKFVKWKVDWNNKRRSWRVWQNWYSWLFHLRPSRVWSKGLSLKIQVLTWSNSVKKSPFKIWNIQTFKIWNIQSLSAFSLIFGLIMVLFCKLKNHCKGGLKPQPPLLMERGVLGTRRRCPFLSG